MTQKCRDASLFDDRLTSTSRGLAVTLKRSAIYPAEKTNGFVIAVTQRTAIRANASGFTSVNLFSHQPGTADAFHSHKTKSITGTTSAQIEKMEEHKEMVESAQNYNEVSKQSVEREVIEQATAQAWRNKVMSARGGLDTGARGWRYLSPTH